MITFSFFLLSEVSVHYLGILSFNLLSILSPKSGEAAGWGQRERSWLLDIVCIMDESAFLFHLRDAVVTIIRHCFPQGSRYYCTLYGITLSLSAPPPFSLSLLLWVIRHNSLNFPLPLRSSLSICFSVCLSVRPSLSLSEWIFERHFKGMRRMAVSF